MADLKTEQPRYDTGHKGDACIAGFASRKPEIVIYIAEGFESRGAPRSR